MMQKSLFVDIIFVMFLLILFTESSLAVTVNPGQSIQHAIDSLPAGGGLIELAAGLHEVNDTLYPPQNHAGVLASIVINKSNVFIIGTHNTFVKHYNNSIHTFYIPNNGIDNTTFRGFNTGSSYSSPNKKYFIYAYNTTNLTVQDIYDTAYQSCFVLTTSDSTAWSGLSRDITYKDLYIANSLIAVLRANNTLIENVTIMGGTGENNAIWCDQLNYNLIVRNCTVQNAGGNAGLIIDKPYNSLFENIELIQTVESNRWGLYINLGAWGNTIVRNITIHGGFRYGIFANHQAHTHPLRLENCKIYNINGIDGYGVYTSPFMGNKSEWMGSYTLILDNCVIKGCDGDAIHLDDTNITLILNNSIVANNGGYGINVIRSGGLIHNYNCFYNNIKGDFKSTVLGTGEIQADPKFADAANNDYHLKAKYGRYSGGTWINDAETSPCIDAGDPSSDYSNEPSPNGGRRNMGAYGNTAEASKSSGEDTVPPTITYHSPTGTNVPIGTTITVTFSEGMNKTSVENAFSVYPSLSGSFGWTENRLIFTPASNLPNHTTFTVTIGTGAEDLVGNNLQFSYSWGFTTLTGGVIFSSGWESEADLVRISDDDKWSIQCYAFPHIGRNLRGDGKWVLISNREVNDKYFGYYYDCSENKWVEDNSLIKGLISRGWREYPAFAYNVTGDGKWTLISHQLSFYGYYWNGVQWVEDSSRVNGLPADIGWKTSHTLLGDLKGDGRWTLISGTPAGTFRAFYWDKTKWVEDPSRVNGLPDIGGDSRITAGYNVFGENRWDAIVTTRTANSYRVFCWDGTKWNEDTSKALGLKTDLPELVPTLGYNLRGDGKWVLISGVGKSYTLLGFQYNTVDVSSLPPQMDIQSYHPLATSVRITFSYPYTWNHRVKYWTKPNMSDALWSEWFEDMDEVDVKLTRLTPASTYYYEVCTHVPWDTSYYITSPVKSFTTPPAQNPVMVQPGKSIQDAIEMLPLEGGTLNLAEGIHDINDTIVIYMNNITIQGSHGSIIRSCDPDKDIFIIPHEHPSPEEDWASMPILEDFTFKGFKVTSSNTMRGKNLVQAWNVKNLRVEDILDDSHLANLVVINPSGGSTKAQSKDIFVINNNLSRSSIVFCFSENVHIINNTLNNVASSAGIDINRNNKFVYVFANYVHGSLNYNIRGHGGDYVYIENNILKGAQEGIFNDGLSNTLISNNTIIGSSYAVIEIEQEWGLPNITIRNNRMYENSGNGILTTTDPDAQEDITEVNVTNNVIYNNSGDGIRMTDARVKLNIINNIITNNKGYGIKYIETIAPTTIKYNNVWNNALGNYMSITPGTGDISADPLFADPVNKDFHLKSQAGRRTSSGWVTDSITSPCIDAGDPASPYSKEPTPNGGRINMGAYGNTPEASKSLGGVDTIPPTTTTTIAGVVVTFFRSDYGSGISYTNYSKISETGPWTTVSTISAIGPDAGNVTDISENKFNVSVTNEGTTTIWYYSVDSNFNVEPTKNVTFTTFPVPGNDTVIIQSPSDVNDNRLREVSPDTVLGNTAYIDVGRIGSFGNYRDVIWFNLSQLNASDQIKSATLSLFWYYESRNKSTMVEIYRPVDWDENYVNWNNRIIGVAWNNPGGDWYDKNDVAQGNTPYASLTFPLGAPDNAYHDFDVTELVQSYVNGISDNTGFFIKANEVDDSYIAFRSSDWENASERPKLIMSYSWGSSPSPENGAVSGTITYTNNGTGIPGVTINLSQGGSVIASTTTDSNGNYIITNVAPGSYTMTASKIRFWPNSSSVTITAGETVIVNRALWLKGDLNNNDLAADAGDEATMMDASVGKIVPDWRYDLNLNGIVADAGDQAMLKDASVGKIELV